MPTPRASPAATQSSPTNGSSGGSDTWRQIAKQLDQIRQRIGRGQLHGKDKIGVRVGKVLNKYKVGKHFTLDIRDNSFSFEIDDTKVTAGSCT